MHLFSSPFPAAISRFSDASFLRLHFHTHILASLTIFQGFRTGRSRSAPSPQALGPFTLSMVCAVPHSRLRFLSRDLAQDLSWVLIRRASESRRVVLRRQQRALSACGMWTSRTHCSMSFLTLMLRTLTHKTDAALTSEHINDLWNYTPLDGISACSLHVYSRQVSY